MIGKRFKLGGTVFTIIGESGDDWEVSSDTDPDLDVISKQQLIDAIQMGDAEEIIY